MLDSSIRLDILTPKNQTSAVTKLAEGMCIDLKAVVLSCVFLVLKKAELYHGEPVSVFLFSYTVYKELKWK